MAYSSGGLIQAIDYNYFTWGGNTTGIYSGTINNLALVWGTGFGYKGMGQDVSLISAVSVTPTTTLITAAQWAGVVYTLNRTLGHQSGAAGQLASGSNIGITAGATITSFANVSTAITSINTNANLYNNTQGTTTVGSVFTSAISFTAGSQTANTFQATRTVTFAGGADAVRYFFNAGGELRLVFLGGVNTNGTARTNDFIELFCGNIGNVIMRGASSQGIAGGSRGNVTANITTLGYWGLTTSNQVVANVASSGSVYTYKTDYANVNVKSSGVAGANGDKGATVTFNFFGNSTAAQTNSNFNDNVNGTILHRVDIVAPETTYLANTWGVIGVT